MDFFHRLREAAKIIKMVINSKIEVHLKMSRINHNRGRLISVIVVSDFVVEELNIKMCNLRTIIFYLRRGNGTNNSQHC